MPRKTTRLFVGRMKSVGFVDRGACEGADILTAKTATPETATMIKKQGDEFMVMDADGTTVLGRHKTKAKAQAQLAAIEANASKRALLMPDAADWGTVLKLAGATRPLLDEAEALFWGTAQKAEEACAPKTFNEVEDLAAVRDEMWKVWDRFRTSVNSIIESDADNKGELLTTSVNEFQAFLTAAAPKWADGKSAMKEAPMPTPATQKQPEATKAAPVSPTATATAATSASAAPTLPDEARKALSPEATAYVEHLEAATAKFASATAGETVSKADHDAALAAKDAEIASLSERLAAADPDAAEEQAFKALPPSQQALVRKAREDAAEARKLAEAEVERREELEAREAAKTYAPLAKPDTMGPLLRRVEKGTATAADLTELKRVLASAAEVARKSDLFTAKGQDEDPGDAGTATQKIEFLAQKRAGEKGESLPKARTEVRKLHRDLARQEREEQAASRH